MCMLRALSTYNSKDLLAVLREHRSCCETDVLLPLVSLQEEALKDFT